MLITGFFSLDLSFIEVYNTLDKKENYQNKIEQYNYRDKRILL